MLPTSNRQRGAILWRSPTGKSPLQVSAVGLLGRAPAAILSRTSCDVARHRPKMMRYLTEWRRGLTRQVLHPLLAARNRRERPGMRTVVRTSYSMTQWLIGLCAMVAAALSSPASLHAQTAPATPTCTAPAEFTRLGHTLTHMARRLASGEPITIVAFGSSSTAGAGASSPAATYPSRLEADLKTRFPGRTAARMRARCWRAWTG